MPVILGCNGPLSIFDPDCWSGGGDVAPGGISKELDDQLRKAANGNAALYAAARAQAESEQQDLSRLQSQDGWCTYTLGACDTVSNIANKIGSAAQTAVTTIGLTQIALVAVVGFALYKILSSETAKSTLVELVKK